MKKVLFKIKGSDDRDSVVYIELPFSVFECDHYFSSIKLQGPNFSSELKLDEDEKHLIFWNDEIALDNLDTILSKEDFIKLYTIEKSLNELKHGITKGDKRYQAGLNLSQLDYIKDKLSSDKYFEYEKRIREEETEIMCDQYGLSLEDMEAIREQYPLEYFDRGIIGYIETDYESLAREYIESTGVFQSSNLPFVENYFDYESFGEDLVSEGEQYLELDDGRIVMLSF